MRRFLCLLVVVVATGSCGGSDSGGIAVETYNVALAGAFIPFEAERRAPLAQAIANMNADVVCLQEVWTQADKEMIRDAAVTRFPYSAIFINDLDTPLDDDTDQDGEVPPAPTTVPCPPVEDDPGVTVEEQMNTAIDCVSANCSTMPGSEDGMTTSTSCAAEKCLDAVGDLLVLSSEQQMRCYACLATQLPTSTFGEIRASCPSVINQDLAFEGQNGVMILSRYPLKDSDDWVIPGTWNQRVIVNATVELPDGSEMDVYCNHLTPIFDDLTFPYTGQYGGGEGGAKGWEAEQFLQAEKLIDYVQSTSGETPAVIMGDLNAGREYAPDIVAEGAPTLELLETEFTPAYTEAYEPLCTFCTTNPITDTLASVWIDHILLHNLTAEAVVSTSRTFDQNVLSVDGQMIPLSDHYGLRSVLTLPTPSP